MHLILETRRGSEIMETPDASYLLASAHIANDETTASLHLDNRNPTPQVRQPKSQTLLSYTCKTNVFHMEVREGSGKSRRCYGCWNAKKL